jgi:hypothetical protein
MQAQSKQQMFTLFIKIAIMYKLQDNANITAKVHKV